MGSINPYIHPKQPGIFHCSFEWVVIRVLVHHFYWPSKIVVARPNFFRLFPNIQCAQPLYAATYWQLSSSHVKIDFEMWNVKDKGFLKDWHCYQGSIPPQEFQALCSPQTRAASLALNCPRECLVCGLDSVSELHGTSRTIDLWTTSCSSRNQIVFPWGCQSLKN